MLPSPSGYPRPTPYCKECGQPYNRDLGCTTCQRRSAAWRDIKEKYPKLDRNTQVLAAAIAAALEKVYVDHHGHRDNNLDAYVRESLKVGIEHFEGFLERCL